MGGQVLEQALLAEELLVGRERLAHAVGEEDKRLRGLQLQLLRGLLEAGEHDLLQALGKGTASDCRGGFGGVRAWWITIAIGSPVKTGWPVSIQ